MKRMFVALAAAMLLVGCGGGYVVKGTIEGYSGEVKLMANKSDECFGSTTTTDGTFEIEVDTEAPLFANLVAGDKSRMLFVEEGVVEVNGSLEKWGDLTVTGTAANDNNALYRAEKEALMEAYVAAQAKRHATLPNRNTTRIQPNPTRQIRITSSAFICLQPRSTTR